MLATASEIDALLCRQYYSRKVVYGAYQVMMHSISVSVLLWLCSRRTSSSIVDWAQAHLIRSRRPILAELSLWTSACSSEKVRTHPVSVSWSCSTSTIDAREAVTREMPATMGWSSLRILAKSSISNLAVWAIAGALEIQLRSVEICAAAVSKPATDAAMESGSMRVGVMLITMAGDGEVGFR